MEPIGDALVYWDTHRGWGNALEPAAVAATSVAAEVRLYDRLFTEAQPDAGGREFVGVLNPDSKRVVAGYVEPGVDALPGTSFQFERVGYFVADRVDSTTERPVFNRSATLRDSWQR